MRFHSLSRFAKSLECAAREFLSAAGIEFSDEYNLRVEECPVHGVDCARVIYGMLCDHVIWRWADTKQIAESTMQSMLPRPRTSA
jgi:hypothetical protein